MELSGISQDKLKKLFSYNQETGEFTRLTTGYQNQHKVGDVAGSINSIGYVLIKIKGRSYKAHRLAFLYMNGRWPEKLVDHKDRVRSNNKWSNLKEATKHENDENRSNNSSGHIGVYWCGRREKWHAKAQLNGVTKHLGYFHKDDALSAGLAYQSFKMKTLELSAKKEQLAEILRKHLS